MWLLDELERRYNNLDDAIVYRETSLSFADLWRKSELLAYKIEQTYAGKDPIVIYGNKDIDIIVAMVASLKTGRAYVPVDITFPKARVLQILSMVNCKLLLNFSQEDFTDANLVVFDKKYLETEIYNNTDNVSGFPRDKWVSGNDNCYILFTSGSTGDPKGVPITRNNIENFTSWFSPYCKLPLEKQVIMNQVSYSFDVSVIPIYIYLAMGKTLFNIDKSMVEDFGSLFKYFSISDMAVWISTPAFLEICNFDDAFNRRLLPKMEKFILAGEVLTKKLVSSVKNKFNEAVIINGYGPTEGTVLLSACEITDKMLLDKKNIPIGMIFEEASYRIVDENDTAVAATTVGELVIISRSISSGYYNDIKQTAEKFFIAGDGRTGYRTGDLVMEEKGLLYYISRKDSQIKLNGFRIEIEDISSNLNKIEFISNNIVIPVYQEEKIKFLVAFVTLAKKTEESYIRIGMKIKNELKNRIPSYMVPRKIVVLEQFPLNTNGKIDRKKLLEEI